MHGSWRFVYLSKQCQLSLELFIYITFISHYVDVVRPEAAGTVRQLVQLGCSVVMLTGDAVPVAEKVCCCFILHLITFALMMFTL